MTELSFLLDLLFNHKLPKSAKAQLLERIKLLEEMQISVRQAPVNRMPMRADQMPPAPPPIPVEQVAQTPEAAAAIASRNAAIAQRLDIPKGQERPRKW